MRRAFLGTTLIALAAACGSSSSSSSASSTDPTALVTEAHPIAKGIAIAQVAAYQTFRVPLAKDGQRADHGKVPIIAGRDLMVRVYVTPDSSFSSRSITARLKLVTGGPEGLSITRVISLDKNVSAASTEEDLKSTFDFDVPGAQVGLDTQFAVALTETQGSGDASNTGARYPGDDTLDTLDASNAGGQIRLMIVPVKYMADGSGRLPDTSDAALQRYRDWMYRLYPAPRVEVTVRDPWPWSSPISGGGTQGFEKILQALAGLRGNDQPSFDTYYYAAFEPTASFSQFCGGGCITGLSNLGSPTSVGIGYGDETTATTLAHEVGHAHGLQHAPCGGAANPDPGFPYPGGGIGTTWAYDQTIAHGMLLDPKGYKDIMSYCGPPWISDYFYLKLFTRIKGDNGVSADRFVRERRLYRMLSVDGQGHATYGESAWLDRRPLDHDDDREATFVGPDGAVVARATGFFAPYSHLPGGTIFVPEPGSRYAAMRVSGVAGDVVAP